MKHNEARLLGINFVRAVVSSLVIACLPTTPAAAQQGRPAGVRVKFETELGDIVLEVDLQRAPMAGQYFLGHVDRGHYDGATFYRAGSVDGMSAPQLVQGGTLQAYLNSTGPVDVVGLGITLLPQFETTQQSGLRHRRGTLSLARDLMVSGAAIPEFVLYLRDAPKIDENGMDRPDRRGYPAIGEVVGGMDVVEAVARRERSGDTTIAFLQGQILTQPVRIFRAARIVQDAMPEGDERPARTPPD